MGAYSELEEKKRKTEYENNEEAKENLKRRLDTETQRPGEKGMQNPPNLKLSGLSP